jgi:hypothetical protein
VKKLTLILTILFLSATSYATDSEKEKNFPWHTNKILVQDFKNELFMAIGAVDITSQVKKNKGQEDWMFGEVNISWDLLDQHLKSICRKNQKYEQMNAWKKLSFGNTHYIFSTYEVHEGFADVVLIEDHELILVTPPVAFQVWVLSKNYERLENLKKKKKTIN